MLLSIFLLGLSTSYTLGNLEGPFLFWGPKKLEQFRKPALKRLEQDDLLKIYKSHGSIVVFNNQGSTQLVDENFPRLHKLLEDKTLLVLPQGFLDVHPDYVNNDTQMLTLVGPPSERDAQITETFERLEDIHGVGNVLAILGNSASPDYDRPVEEFEDISLKRVPERKRRAVPETESRTDDGAKEEEVEYLPFALYNTSDNAPIKALLFSTSRPVLRYNETGETIVLKTSLRSSVASSNKGNKFIVTFLHDGNKIFLKFRFSNKSNNYWWTLGGVEVEEHKTGASYLLQPPKAKFTPSAPIGRSYHCSRPIVFTGVNATLTFKNIQPYMTSTTKFSDSFDCTGFITVPIWSGLGITFMLLIALTISIIMILDIKTMDKFDNSKTKSLNITVWE